MKQALSHLVGDFLSAILFLAAYLASGSITLAASIAVTAGLLQLGALKLRGWRIEPMQWISLGLVVVLSGAAMLTQSPRFIMVKPSIVHFAIAAVMLRRGWTVRYLPQIGRDNLPEGVPVAAGYAWAALMAALGLANLGLALYGDLALWAWFISVGAIGAKIIAFVAQYAVFRTIIRRRLKEDRTVGSASAAMRASTVVPVFVAGLVLFGIPQHGGAVGFHQGAIPDPQGEPLQVDIWYPSDAPASPHRLGLFRQTVAVDGAIAGSQLPLIVISHGTGGSAEGHYDTALALAQAGFIAAAITHTGDNWRDRRYSFTRRNFTERPRQLKLALDYLLTEWFHRDHIAVEKIGSFGHSAGGFTVLVAIGGVPDFALAALSCKEHPEDWGCVQARRVAAGAPAEAPTNPNWTHDPRIKAAVIAATALGHTFTRAGLAGVTVPVQLWQAENDQIAVSRWSSDIIKANLPSPPETHLVLLAGHFAFLAPCRPELAERVPEICQDAPGFDRVAFHRNFNAAIVEFFSKQFPAHEASK